MNKLNFKIEKATIVILLALLSISFYSCNNEDEPIGGWDPLVFSVESKSEGTIVSDESSELKDTKVTVPSQGGSVNLLCTNYTGFWCASIIIFKEDHYVGFYNTYNGPTYSYINNYKDNSMTEVEDNSVIFSPKLNSIKGDWFTIECDVQNLIMTFDEAKEDVPRYKMELTIELGNAFRSIIILPEE